MELTSAGYYLKPHRFSRLKKNLNIHVKMASTVSLARLKLRAINCDVSYADPKLRSERNILPQYSIAQLHAFMFQKHPILDAVEDSILN